MFLFVQLEAWPSLEEEIRAEFLSCAKAVHLVGSVLLNSFRTFLGASKTEHFLHNKHKEILFYFIPFLLLHRERISDRVAGCFACTNEHLNSRSCLHFNIAREVRQSTALKLRFSKRRKVFMQILFVPPFCQSQKSWPVLHTTQCIPK